MFRIPQSALLRTWIDRPTDAPPTKDAHGKEGQLVRTNESPRLLFFGATNEIQGDRGVERIFKHKSSHFHEKKYWSRQILDNLFLEVIQSYTQILKFFYYPLWPIAKFVSFLLWMMIATVICDITKLMEESRKKDKGKKKKHNPEGDRRDEHTSESSRFCIIWEKGINTCLVILCVCVYIYLFVYRCVLGGVCVSEGRPAIMHALDLVCTIVAGKLISSCLVGVRD